MSSISNVQLRKTMKTALTVILATLASALLGAATPLSASEAPAQSRGARPAQLQPIQVARLSAIPQGFIPNVGQWPNEFVRFGLRDSGASAFFTDQGFVLWNGQTTTTTHDGVALELPVAPRWRLIGAKPVEPVGGEKFAHTVSYFRGNDPAKWRAKVPAYRDLRYPGILNGVELRVASRESGFEYSFHVQPHAKPDLRFRYDGITGLEESLTGDLIVRTAHGHFTESRPIAFQWIDGTKRDIASSFQIVSAKEYRIVLGPYDERHELVIDPVLDWSTFLGATYSDDIRDVKIDPSGNICVAGIATSTDLPDTAAFSTGPGVNYDSNLGVWFEDTIVAKLSPDGAQLLWLGYLGGAGATDDYVGWNGLAADSAGNLYVSGYSTSPDFPVTAGAFQGNPGGDWDAFVTKIRFDGANILWSSFLGGADVDWSVGIALDSQENVVLTGFTLSSDFPTLSASDPTLGGARDAFVTKFDAAGAVQWSTYLGGSGNADRSAALVANAAGEIFVFGDTDSADLATAGDTTLGGANDAFVTKLSANGVPAWTTLIGGSGLENDEVNPYSPIAFSRGDIVLDSAGHVLIGGETTSSDFPVTPGAFDVTLSGTADGYVAKLAGNDASLLWASYLGGSGGGQFQDRVWGIAVNPWDEVFLIGRTDSPSFPVTADAVQTSFQGGMQDGFLTKLSVDGSTLLYSTYLGGSEYRDVALGIAYDAGSVFVAGWAVSASFPATAGAYQTACFSCNLNGWADGVVLKFLDAFIAHDGFESGNYSGGTGWTGNWTATGDISILTSFSPHSGSRHVRLRRGTGLLSRTVTVPPGTTTLKLGFWSKVNSFESADNAVVRVTPAGGSPTTLITYAAAHSDNTYHYDEFDLSSMISAASIQITFDANMSGTDDQWYLDDVRVTGKSVAPPPPADPLHSGDLDGSATNSGKNNWKATVVVTMHDGNEQPVQGATVLIAWGGGASGTASLVTDASGRCTFVSGNITKSSPNATLTITGATHSTLTYSAVVNHDPDGDSNGTSITVNKP